MNLGQTDQPELPEMVIGAANDFAYGVSPQKKAILVRHPEKLTEKSTELQIPGLVRPSCMAFSPDAWTLYVGAAEGKWVWAFRLEKDGTLTAGQPYCSLRVADGQKDMPVAALTVDADGRIYAVTAIGVQIFDPTGRLCGVLTNPTREPLAGIAFGGPNGDRLFLASNTTVYVRKVNSRAIGLPVER